MKNLLFLLLLLALPAPLPAKSKKKPGEDGNVRAAANVITSQRLFRDNGQGQPGEEISNFLFLPTDRTQHFLVTLAPGTDLGPGPAKWAFTATDTTAGQNIPITQVTTAAGKTENLKASLTLPADWPAGFYQAEILLGAEPKPFLTLHYAISKPTDQLAATSDIQLRRDTKGQPGEETSAFPPAQRRLHFALPLDGIPAPGAKVKWTYTVLKTATAENKPLSEDTYTIAPGAGLDRLQRSSVSLPNDWPEGQYRVQFHLDDKPLAQRDFTIAK